MALVIDEVRSFDAASPFAGWTTSGSVATPAGRTANAAQLNGSGGTAGVIQAPVSGGISCGALCGGGGGTRIRQALVVGFGNCFTGSYGESLLNFEGNYGFFAQILVFNGRFQASIGFADGSEFGGNTSAVSTQTVVPINIWHFAEVYLDFDSQVCPTADPNIYDLTYSATIGARINGQPTSEMPTVSFSRSWSTIIGPPPQPSISIAEWLIAGAGRRIDDVYLGHMSNCVESISFLGDLRVNSDDSTYTQDPSDTWETQQVLEWIQDADPSSFVTKETHEVLEVVLGETIAGLTIRKVVIGGPNVAADWIVSADGPTPISGAGEASSMVNPGTYTLSESGPLGYTRGPWVCVGGTQVGDTVEVSGDDPVVCTITNTYPEPPPTPEVCIIDPIETPTPSFVSYTEPTELAGS